MKVRCSLECYGNCDKCNLTMLQPDFFEDIEGFMLIIRKERKK